MTVIDFTQLPKRNKMYAGANGNKICIIYEDEPYMLKFPPMAKQNKDMSYSNSCFSEYLGCQIFGSIGVPVQKTMLGTYIVKGKEKIVAACGDFTQPGVTLQDFASLKNQMIDSGQNGYGTELSDILLTFEEQTIMKSVLAKPAEQDYRIYEIPTSAVMIGGKKIKYFDFISSLQNEGCNRALKRIVPCIDMKRIGRIIDDTPFINDLQRQFYLTMLTKRKRLILDYSLSIL